jgi:hypothetical protein
MRLSDVIDDLYDRVLGCQDALQGDDDEDDEYIEEDYFPEDEE